VNIQIKLYQQNFYSNVFTMLQLFSQQMKSYGVHDHSNEMLSAVLSHSMYYLFSNDLDCLQILDIFLLLDKICFL